MTLRGKFLLALLLTSAALTSASLVVVRRVVSGHIRKQIVQDLDRSVATFENVRREREANLARSTELMADLPIVRALMTTRHAATIQDASTRLWAISGSELMVLSDASGKVMAVQASGPNLEIGEVQKELSSSLALTNSVQWWRCGGRLFELAIRPIYLGDARFNHVIGFLVLGSEINDRVAHELSQVAESDVVFRSGDTLIRSTLAPEQERAMDLGRLQLDSAAGPTEITLGNETFLVKDIALSQAPANIRLTVLKSLDQSVAFLKTLDRLLLGLGVAALVLGAVLVWVLARTITRPLQSLVLGVRALAKSDFHYPLTRKRGNDEVAELTAAFRRMRDDLQNSQRKLLESERLATIGQMASSISHDLRHHLVAIFSNAEFLIDSRRSATEREELYDEIRTSVHQMNDLVDSLLEFSRTRESLRLSPCHVEDAIQAAIRSIQSRPEFRKLTIEVNSPETSECLFDAKRLERVLHNLLLNACEAAPLNSGKVEIQVREEQGYIEIRITDNGRGIPEPLREKIFEPFFTEGKANGTGLGLTIAQKIVQDHGGELRLDSSSSVGSTFCILLPLKPVAGDVIAAHVTTSTVGAQS